jgi:3D (Asp-Asp-Asp) domain-containing protein
MIALAAAAALTASSTSYCPGSSGGTMADGHRVHVGAVASNRHPLGTRIRLVGAHFLGRRTFIVEDRIGSGSDLDLWSPSCSYSRRWGRRRIRYRVTGRRG